MDGFSCVYIMYISSLTFQGLLLYSDFQESTFDLSSLPNRRFEAMDHFQKCFLIVKLKKDQVVGQQAEQRCGRDWKAVRVDLVAPPAERYAFALLGWSGSTVRDKRSVGCAPNKSKSVYPSGSRMLGKLFLICIMESGVS